MKSLFIVFLFIGIGCFQIKASSPSRKKVDSLNALGYTYISNNLNRCEKLYEQNLKDAQTLAYPLGEAQSYSSLGLVYCLKGNYDPGIQAFMKAAKIYEQLEMYLELACTYGDIGFRIRYIDVKRSTKYFKMAIEILDKYDIKKGGAAIYNNYGEVLKQVNYDSALFYYKKGLVMCKREKDSLGIPFSLNNLAEEYARRKDFKLAFKYLNESDSYRFRSEDQYGWADNWAYRGDIFYEMPKADSAIFYYEKCLSMADKNQFFALQRYCSERLSNLYRMKNDFKTAFSYFERFKNLEDSSLNADVKGKMANLQVEFETEKTQRELAEHKTKLAKNELKLETRFRWILIGSGLIILLVITLLFVYRYQRSKRKNALAQMELNSQLENTRMEKEFADEKIRIARELHDNIGSHLTFMISTLDNLSYLKDQEQKLNKIQDLSSFGRQTMKDLRDTIWAMNHDGGSFEQLSSRILELRNVLPPHLHIDLKADVRDELPLNGLQLLNLYRIVQEFMQNTIKYAEASEIKLSFFAEKNKLLVELSDNGKGFEPEKAALGNGLLNMKQRCEDLSGTFEIHSNDKGTVVCCEIPM